MRLTSLFGGRGGAVELDRDSIGTVELFEKVTDGGSAMKLDLALPCWDSGRMDSRFNHEPLDDIESLDPSATLAGEDSPPPCLTIDCLLPRILGDVTWELWGRW